MSLKNLALFTVLWALVVVVLGAYVRLNDAGLSCPDWPGCYGELVVPEGDAAVKAQQLYPDTPLEHGKAWLEMAHRYLAAFLGLAILAIFYISFSRRKRISRTVLVLSSSLVPLVIFQGALGMWTVTQKLDPFIVTAHLGGGMAILLLLWLLYLQVSAADIVRTVQLEDTGLLRIGAIVAIMILGAQILLGAWVSANYSALVCDSFPGCSQDYALPPWQSFSSIFQLQHTGGVDIAAAIHMTHRVGALITTLALVLLGYRCWRVASVRSSIVIMLSVLTVHIGVAIANVYTGWPVLTAALHNAFAAILLLSTVTIYTRMVQTGVKVERK